MEKSILQHLVNLQFNGWCMNVTTEGISHTAVQQRCNENPKGSKMHRKTTDIVVRWKMQNLTEHIYKASGSGGPFSSFQWTKV